MSSSSRKRGAPAVPALRAFAAGGACAGAGLLAASGASAAEVYYQPVASLSSSYNSNIFLDPANKQSGEGYYADAATTIGIATPNSVATLEPRLIYNYYPSQHELDRLEGVLNGNGQYSWQRDRVNIVAYYDHRDDVNAEQPGAQDNTVNPGVGTTTPSSGQVLKGVVRDYLILQPSYTHLLTPLSNITLNGEYQRLSYNDEDSGHVPFDYYLGRITYNWAQTQRMGLGVNAFAANFQAATIDAKSNTGGIGGSLKYDWTPALSGSVTASYERTKVEQSSHDFNETANEWAAQASLAYTGQLATYRATIGRVIVPGASGGLFATNQLQGQYERDLSQRLHFTGAIRYFRDGTLTGFRGDDTRNYLNTVLSLRWMMTRTLFISGAYNFTWQKYVVDPNSANANRVSLSIGYMGLQRQTR